jgi:hypothetical protein
MEGAARALLLLAGLAMGLPSAASAAVEVCKDAKYKVGARKAGGPRRGASGARTAVCARSARRAASRRAPAPRPRAAARSAPGPRRAKGVRPPCAPRVWQPSAPRPRTPAPMLPAPPPQVLLGHAAAGWNPLMWTPDDAISYLRADALKPGLPVLILFALVLFTTLVLLLW